MVKWALILQQVQLQLKGECSQCVWDPAPHAAVHGPPALQPQRVSTQSQDTVLCRQPGVRHQKVRAQGWDAEAGRAAGTEMFDRNSGPGCTVTASRSENGILFPEGPTVLPGLKTCGRRSFLDLKGWRRDSGDLSW